MDSVVRYYLFRKVWMRARQVKVFALFFWSFIQLTQKADCGAGIKFFPHGAYSSAQCLEAKNKLPVSYCAVLVLVPVPGVRVSEAKLL